MSFSWAKPYEPKHPLMRWIDELQLLQDRVPPVSIEAVRDRIEAELGRPVAELFAELSPTPLASA